MMDVVGYAIIKDGAKGISPIPLEKFYKDRVRVMEFAKDGGVLVMDREASGVAFFESDAVVKSFQCQNFMEVLLPPNLTSLYDKMEYYGRCMMRVGGYNNLLREMVIAASLHKGEFNDGFLWQKQQS